MQESVGLRINKCQIACFSFSFSLYKIKLIASLDFLKFIFFHILFYGKQVFTELWFGVMELYDDVGEAMLLLAAVVV
jgi:hypothetical protein